MAGEGASQPPQASQTATAAGAIAVALPSEDLAWARARAEREGTTVPTVVSHAVRKARQLEARVEVLAWLADGQRPLTAEELDAVEREWKG